MHIAEGLNWGLRTGQCPNQAYIPIPTTIAKSDFFPPIGKPFSVLTDDKFPLICIKTSPKKSAGKKDYAIEATNSVELGKYFRRRLKLKPDAFVTLENLEPVFTAVSVGCGCAIS